MGNAPNVVHHGTGTHYTVVIVAATAKLYPELKNSSGKRHSALPMLASSISPVYHCDPLSILDHIAVSHPGALVY
jgi:hypothetical protein